MGVAYNAIAIYEQNDLLNDKFYSDDNVKRLSGAVTVTRLRVKKVAGADWDERISTRDFVKMESPTRVDRPELNIPPVRFEPSRLVKDEKVISGHLFVVFQADYAGIGRSVITPLLGRACREDQDQEIAQYMANTREAFNPPLGHKRPVVLSCTDAHKKMTLDFGLAEAGADPMLHSIQIVETSE